MNEFSKEDKKDDKDEKKEKIEITKPPQTSMPSEGKIITEDLDKAKKNNNERQLYD